MKSYEETEGTDDDRADCALCKGVGRCPSDRADEWVECGVCNGTGKVIRTKERA